MTPIPVLYSFARSGGTLVNQLLGVHPQCLVLSEVNPAASCKPVAEQALQWLGLVSSEEARELARAPYHRQIADLHERAASRGKRLVVRDWITVNYLPGCFGSHLAPSGRLEQEAYLARAGLLARPIVIPRRATAVLASIRATLPHLQNIETGVFAKSYLDYARAVSGYPRVTLDELRSNPGGALTRILDMLGLDSSHPAAQLERFHEFRQCTGNNTLKSPRESASATRVLPPSAADRNHAQDDDRLAEADRLLGYE